MMKSALVGIVVLALLMTPAMALKVTTKVNIVGDGSFVEQAISKNVGIKTAIGGSNMKLDYESVFGTESILKVDLTADNISFGNTMNILGSNLGSEVVAKGLDMQYVVDYNHSTGEGYRLINVTADVVTLLKTYWSAEEIGHGFKANGTIDDAKLFVNESLVNSTVNGDLKFNASELDGMMIDVLKVPNDATVNTTIGVNSTSSTNTVQVSKNFGTIFEQDVLYKGDFTPTIGDLFEIDYCFNAIFQ